MKIYHNPRCRKSREALQLLQDKGHNPDVVLYLDDTPTKDEFKMLLQKLNMKPAELLRKGEAVYKEKFKNSSFTDEEWIDVMLEYPKLIERPIVVKDYKAVVGRPPERVLELI